MSKSKRWVEIEGRFNLAGVQFSDYQLICGRLKAGTICSLVGEPRNPHDRMAVRVEYKGIKLGYLPRFSIQQSEAWNYHNRGCKIVAVITAFNKNNPSWSMITVQLKRTDDARDTKHIDEVKM